VELFDTSVWTQRRHTLIGAGFQAAMLAEQIAICDMIALEILRSEPFPTVSARAADLRRLPWIEMHPQDWRRSFEVQLQLAGRGTQRSHRVKVADLLIAAAAERAGITVTHYDQDYEIIAEVTGQPVRWVAPRGSLSVTPPV